MTVETQPQDAGRRRRRGADRGGATSAAQAPRQPQAPFAPLEFVSRDELESIHDAALTALKEIGVDFLHDEARAILKRAGADVDPASKRVRFDPALVEAHIGLAPKEFTLHARNPGARSDNRRPSCGLRLGRQRAQFVRSRRRPAARETSATTRTSSALGRASNSIHFWGGYPVEPIDIHASVRHLEALFDVLTLSDKPIHAYSLGRERNLDAIEMVRIARGIDDATLEREPSLFTVINSSSPLRLDTPMLEGILQMARRNQVVVLTPFTLAGAMAPVTLAGALAQQHAEALAGLVMTQAVRPGAPFVYGGFTSNVDMKSGAPAFGTPEYIKTAIVGGQLARRLSLPYRSSNTNAANSLDAQAGYESVFSLWGAIMGGANFLMHGAGWMEGGLQASFEKMALDADLLAMVAEFLRPLRVERVRTGAGGDARGRPRRSFLRRRTHKIALSHRFLRADDFRLAQLRDLAGGGIADRGRRGRPRCRRTVAGFRRPAVRTGAPRGAGGLCRPAQGRGRRADGLLILTPPMRAERASAPGCMRRSPGVFFFFGVGVGLWGGASGAILTRAGVDAAAFGIILTVYTGAYLAAMSASGALSHRFGVSRVLPVSAIIFGASLCAALNASSAAAVAAVFVATGFLGGVVDVTMNAEGARIERGLGRPILARLHAAASAGMALGAILGSLIVASAAPWAAGVLAALGLAAAGLAYDRAARGEGPAPVARPDVVDARPFVCAGA